MRDIVRMFMDRLPSAPAPAWGADLVKLSLPDESLPDFVNRLTATANAPIYRLPSVKASLGVPSIQRAVSLIAGTTGMLSMQGYRNGSVMDEAPKVVARPDPYSTPQQFYGGTAAQMAKYGEFVWWIATRDGDRLPTALVLVPLHELQVQENPDNRNRPLYRWGRVTSTRYSPASPDGAFVHVMYPLADPFQLRGQGPLQLCRAATSVTVEAQDWAANFYADGGQPSTVIKHADILSGALDEDGLNEADRLRTQFVSRAHNTVRVIDQTIESIDYTEPSVAGAQMLDARQHQNGDAARMYGIPGPLLEYSMAGGSLVYQNRAELMTNFVETCLHPLYLEPIEQAMSDLLSRSTVSRFNVKGFLRADVKTRYEVHQIAIDAGIYDAVYAQQEEGIIAGDVEYAAVPASPPQAIPAPIIRAASLQMRDVRCPSCTRLVGRAEGRAELFCRHCKVPVAA